MPGRIGFPAISTPRRLDPTALSQWQQAVDNIRERLAAVEAAATTLQATTAALAGGTSTASRLAALAREVDRITRDLANLLALFDVDATPADGDVLTWSEDQNQYVPEPPAAVAGGVLPVVTGDVPPILVYLEDGALVYAPVEA